MRRLRGVAAVAAVVGALLLAGCSEIPLTGPVGNGSTQAPDEPAIVFLPAPPASGAKPKDIVSGFVQAASGAGNDYAVAKQYLTSDFAAKWNPNAKVLVYDKTPEVVSSARGSLELDVQTVARVESDGRYTPSTQTVKVPFKLQQVGGQWRIASTLDGIVLAQTLFQRTFRTATLQYFDATYSRLVPDVRWFPTRANQTTSVVRALLKQPTGPLAAGVAATAFPTGTRLEAASTAGDTPMTITLSVPGRQPTKTQTDRMQQQLVRSLQIQPAGALRLVVNGRFAPVAQPLEVQGAAQVPVVYAGGRFGTLQSSGAVSEDAVLGKKVAALKPTAATVSARQRLAAVLAQNRQVAVVSAGATRVVDRRTGLVAPTLDQRTWTYSVPENDPTGLIAVSAAGRTATLSGTDLGGSQVTKIEVSPDGTRMLVLVQRAAGDSLAYVAGIERAADGTPSGLTTDRYLITVPSGQATEDATWADDSDVAILTASTDGSDTVTAQQLGGLSTTIGRLSNATSIVGTSSKGDLRARDSAGNVLEPSSSNVWQNIFQSAVDVDVLAIQR